jgi:hypothetical protein
MKPVPAPTPLLAVIIFHVFVAFPCPLFTPFHTPFLLFIILINATNTSFQVKDVCLPGDFL